VYAIFKDEEANIAEWAETTGDADHRFVLDTGSFDGTHDELHVHGIEHMLTRPDPFRFDDARNTALQLANGLFPSDLYLRLDADERLPDGWRAMIDDAYHPDVPRYRYRVHNNGGIWSQITRDDLHRFGGFRWKYPTHEILLGPAAARDLPGLIVEHSSPPERRSHHLSNLMVLGAATVEYPGDHRMAFYYARELWYSGDWDGCREAMSRFLALPDGWGAERCEAYRILAAIDYIPERWLWKAVGEAPERREPWVDLARLALKAGDSERAVTMFMEAERRTDQTVYTTSPDAWGGAFDDLREMISAALSTVTQ
jgi:hypothetical protein